MTQKASNNPSAFWKDASKRTGTWAAVGALAAVVEDLFDDTGPGGDGFSWEHLAMVGIAAALRAIVALVQGKVGDPDKASFKAAAADNPDVPDDDG